MKSRMETKDVRLQTSLLDVSSNQTYLKEMKKIREGWSVTVDDNKLWLWVVMVVGVEYITSKTPARDWVRPDRLASGVFSSRPINQKVIQSVPYPQGFVPERVKRTIKTTTNHQVFGVKLDGTDFLRYDGCPFFFFTYIKVSLNDSVLLLSHR